MDRRLATRLLTLLALASLLGTLAGSVVQARGLPLLSTEDRPGAALAEASPPGRSAPQVFQAAPTLPPLTGIVQVAAGGAHTCALTDQGDVLCWGANGFGRLGDGSTTSSPTPVAVADLGTGVQAIAAGGEHTCALTDQGGVLCWGANSAGQLGDGRLLYSPTPMDVVAPAAHRVFLPLLAR